MLYLAMVISACLTQLLGWVYILPLCLIGLVQIRFSEYLTREYITTRVPQLIVAAKANPFDMFMWAVNSARGTKIPAAAPAQAQSSVMTGEPFPAFDAWPPVSSPGQP